jgi:hypothetical protein
MRFHIQGTDAQTGQQISTFLEAPTSEAAGEMATQQGILIQSISIASEPPISPTPATYTPSYPSHSENNPFTESLANTWSAWKILVKNPIDGIGIASEALGERGLLQAGLVSGIFYVLSQIFLLNRTVSIVASLFASFLSLTRPFSSFNSSLSDSLGFDFYLKMAILAAVPLGTLTLGLFLARKISQTPDSINSDIFGAGISYLPITLIYTIIAILTPGSFEFIVMLFIWALCVSVLISYHCFTTLSKLPSRLAVYAVPLTVLVNSLFTKIMTEILF